MPVMGGGVLLDKEYKEKCLQKLQQEDLPQSKKVSGSVARSQHTHAMKVSHASSLRRGAYAQRRKTCTAAQTTRKSLKENIVQGRVVQGPKLSRAHKEFESSSLGMEPWLPSLTSDCDNGIPSL